MTRVTIYACTRCGLRANALPEGINLVELQCTGRVTLPLLLAPLAGGDDGVLVLGRHQETCRLQGSEDRALATTERAGQLAELLGLGRQRIRFTVPAVGRGGPQRAAESFLSNISSLSPLALDTAAPADLFGREGFDTTLDLLRWLSQRAAMTPQGGQWLSAHELPGATPDGVALVTTAIPHLEVLGSGLMRPRSLAPHLRHGLELLGALGRREVGIWIGGYLSATHAPRALAQAAEVICFDEGDQRALEQAGVKAPCLEELMVGEASLARPAGEAIVAYDGSPSQRGIIEGLGYRALDVGPDPLGERFASGPRQRLAAEERLTAAEAGGAQTILATDAHALMRWTLQTRQGTWRASRVLPVLPHLLAWHNLRGIPLSPRGIQTHTAAGPAAEQQSVPAPTAAGPAAKPQSEALS